MARSIGDYLMQKYKVQLDTRRPKRSAALNMLETLSYELSRDTYTYTDTCTKRLIEDYKKHKNLIIAYDFDDTVCPTSPTVNTSFVRTLLQFCSTCEFTMICFTARDNETDLAEVKETLKGLKIRCDYINEDAKQTKDHMEIGHNSFHKIFYNVFLDDRAGLQSATFALIGFLRWYVKQELDDTTGGATNDINMF